MPVLAVKLGSPSDFTNGNLLLECSQLLRSIKFVQASTFVSDTRIFASIAIKLQKVVGLCGMCFMVYRPLALNVCKCIRW